MTARRAVERCGLVVRPADEGEQAAVTGIDRDQGRLETWKPKTTQSVADGDFGRILNFLDERRVNFPVRRVVVSDEVPELLPQELLRITMTTVGRR